MKGAQIHLKLRQVSESVIAIGSTSIGEETVKIYLSSRIKIRKGR